MSIERLLEASRAFGRGDLDAAERIYLAVAEVDPRSTIALVGLARVAMARGAETDLAQAERLAATVLQHDPENAAARRLLDEWRARTGTAADPVTPAKGALVDDPHEPPAPRAGPEPASASPEASASASPEASASASPEASGPGPAGRLGEPPGPGADGAPDGSADEATEDDEFPWPDLDEQLARYRERQPGRLGRLFRRRKG